MRDATCPPTAGRHFPAHVELDRRRLHISPCIVLGGGGGGAEVWAGSYDGRPVAVKCCLDVASRPRQLQLDDAFIAEVTAMIRLRHDNVVRLVGVCSTSRPLLVVTDDSFVGTLKDQLRAARIPCSQLAVAGHSRRAQLIDIGLQVTAAVAHLASLRYVLHRNLSASSFVVVSDSRPPRVKLTDFTQARQVSADDRYTADGGELLAVKWAAPEVLTQLQYSTRSDVWAVGVVLWQASHHSHSHLCLSSSVVRHVGYAQQHWLQCYVSFLQYDSQ